MSPREAPKLHQQYRGSASCSVPFETTCFRPITFLLAMKSDEPESDKTVSIDQIQPLISRKLPRVVTSIPGKKSQNESDNDGVAKTTITHSESGTKDRKKGRKLVSELTKMEVKRSKGKDRKRKLVRGPSVDTSRARSSCDVVRLAVRELGWREVCFCLRLLKVDCT